MNREGYEKSRVGCRCGKRLIDIRDHEDGRMIGPPTLVELDCKRCRHIVTRYLRYELDVVVEPNTFLIVHVVDVRRGRVVDTEVVAARPGEETNPKIAEYYEVSLVAAASRAQGEGNVQPGSTGQ